ncbi:DUF992 domain-containing protein (plasmid) [Agrobacterium tumefaciens]|uniref:DUF992 domain-containing protein n=1 Tax=Rhizobium/Agrobacterium group TaxID=227290 RepID=UPI000712EC2D|nr:MULTISPECIES: DUF992 domain-containing protein [Rhizobium/Agrobacterium group]KQY36899.1 hypothetical protein ASD46_20950 [Rhizobium sp. Root491]QTQ85892.1 DUF992 domain-containing protein [Agrobacterium tumefaciens]WCK68793.1 DUF992 domain-containing protein [Agrobacterium tumefaciens]
MRKSLISSLALVAVIGLGASSATAAEHVEAGRLDCDVSAGLGVIVGSQQKMNCVFTPSDGTAKEAYSGTITEFGLDIGEINKAKLSWLVFAPASRDEAALSGTYTGITADAAIGVGVGAKVLGGGLHGTIALQPIALQAEEGVNIAAGITALTLHAAN